MLADLNGDGALDLVSSHAQPDGGLVYMGASVHRYVAIGPFLWDDPALRRQVVRTIATAGRRHRR
jgi:hypothetical protein